MKRVIVLKGGPGSGHHGHAGRPGKRGGSAPGAGNSNYLPSEQRVWQGNSHDGKRKLNNIQTGEIGEAYAAKALEDVLSTEFSTLNEGVNNAPIDLAGNHTAVEVKAGPATNGRSAQHWRATISTAGKAERELLKTMDAKTKREWNKRKQQEVLDRKHALLTELSKEAGAEIRPMTVGVILEPDGSRGDVFMVPGFHLRLGWNHYATEEYYVGTYTQEDIQ